MSAKIRTLAAAVLTAAGLAAAAPVAVPAVAASVSWGAKPAVVQQHAVVADTWTGPRIPARDTWT